MDALLSELIDIHGWRTVPDVITTREGHRLDSAGEIWHLPYATRGGASIDFSKLEAPTIRWATKRFVQDCLEFTSTHSGYAVFQDLWRELFRFQHDCSVNGHAELPEVASNLTVLFESALSKARKGHRLWAMYRSVRWYIWCAENYPELGFSPEYALELSSISIPGNPKGEAVRSEDPDRGPLHRSLELPLLVNAMRNDQSKAFEHLQEKVAVALSIALGRNPANLTYLKESDLVNLTPDAEFDTWIIRMPRIKKRQLNPRDDLLDEFLAPEFAQYVLELIEANRAIETSVELNGKRYAIDKPLFVNVAQNQSALRSGLIDSIFNMTSEKISRLLQQFVNRNAVITPLTGELLRISARRLRYTLGTALAAEGISRKELARILDHSDTQHVQVYFEMAGSIVEHLDKAMAKGFAKYLKLFKGRIVNNDSEAINGSRDDKHLSFINEDNPIEATEIGVCGKDKICHLDPPFSCYLCPKFQPYKHANHEYVLECLLQSRAEKIEKYENARLGIQIDDVIVAVAQVVQECNEGADVER